MSCEFQLKQVLSGHEAGQIRVGVYDYSGIYSYNQYEIEKKHSFGNIHAQQFF